MAAATSQPGGSVGCSIGAGWLPKRICCQHHRSDPETRQDDQEIVGEEQDIPIRPQDDQEIVGEEQDIPIGPQDNEEIVDEKQDKPIGPQDNQEIVDEGQDEVPNELIRQYVPMLRFLEPRDGEQNPSIFKLDGDLNKVSIAAIGPYHRQSENLLITDDKKRGIVAFLQRFYGLDLQAFLRWAQANESRARKCYKPDTVIMKSEEFTEMLLLDGCLLLFAIFILRSSVHEDKEPAKLALLAKENKPEGKKFLVLSADITLHMTQLRLEMLMLDNQIPFFVLAKIKELTKLFEGIKHTIEDMALSCFDEVHPKQLRGKRSNQSPEGVEHLLHLFYRSRVPSGKHDIDASSFLPNESQLHLPSASDLRESATSFRKRSSGSPLDLSFHTEYCGLSGVITIPTLYLYSYSNSIFRNLMAFEQGYPSCGLGVTAYSTYMARLLQAEADVRLLRSDRIVAHTPMTDKEIIDFFKNLGVGDEDNKNRFISKDLRKFYKKVTSHHNGKMGRFTGEIKLKYCPTRLVFWVVFCGILVTLATLVNNFHAMYRIYHPFHASKT